MTTAAIRTAALAFASASAASLAHFEGYENACRGIPVPRTAAVAEIADYAAKRGAAAEAAGFTAAAGGELHRKMVFARAQLLRIAAPMLRLPELKHLRAVDHATQADAILRALGVA